MPIDKENSVFEPSAEWKDMQRYTRLTRALRGGTEAMRAEFPPKQYPLEGDDRYMERVEKTYFLDAFDRAIQGYSDRVLSDGIVLSESTPNWLKTKLNTSVDGRGTKLSSWASPPLQAGLSDGLSYILTDGTSPESGRASAYWTLHTTETVIGGRVDWSDEGAQLRQVRLKEKAEVRKGAYGSVTVDRVRVIDLDGEDGPTWTVWEQDEEGDERVAVEDDKPLSGRWDLDYIPLRQFRTDMQNAHRFFYAVPPQMALVGKNVEHWELSSMVSNNRATNLIPIRTFLGIKKEEFDNINALGAGLAIHSEAPAGDIEVGLVETTGVPLAEGRNELERIEKQMEAQALMPLAPQDYGNVTATRDIIASEEMTSSIKQDAVCYEDTLNAASRDLAAFEPGQEPIPDEQIITIPGKDYAVVNDPSGLDRALDTLERVSSRLPRELRQVALDHAVLYGALAKDTDTAKLVRELDASSGMGGVGTDQRGKVREAIRLMDQGATEDEAIDEVFRPNLAAV